MDQSEIELAADLAAYGLDGEGSISCSDGPAYTNSNHGSDESDIAEFVGDYEHYSHGGNYGQEMMQPIEQELPSMTADHACLLPDYEHTDSDVANVPTYLQDDSYGYFPETSRSTRFDPIVAMHPMPRGWHAPNDGYMGQSFQGPEHFGAVPPPMVQHGLLDSSPGGHHLQPINQFNQHHSEERRGSTSDDPEDDVPLMLRLQQRATSHQSTGHREAISDRNVLTESTLSEDDSQTYDSLPQEDPASAVHATVLPKSNDNARAVAPPSDTALDIDWKLAKFEAIFQVDSEGWATATVSLPGMVREYLFLSPEHPENEFRLIQQVFIPGQQSRVDDAPRVALLNFHTMAVLILDAIALRSRFFGQIEEDDPEIKIDPLTFDTDEIFLSALDNWRVGLACGRKNFNLIRGVQEFFDVALDIVFFIKDNGLVVKKPRERKIRADKGVKRGVRTAPNELQPRKKTKTTAALPPPPPPTTPAKKSKTAKTAGKSKGWNAKAPAKTASKASKKTAVKANTKTKVTKGKVGRPAGKTSKTTLPKGPRGHIKG